MKWSSNHWSHLPFSNISFPYLWLWFRLEGVGCFMFTGSLQEIMFQIKLIGYSEDKGANRSKDEGEARKGVHVDWYVVSCMCWMVTLDKRIPPMFVPFFGNIFTHYWWESYHLRKIFKSCNKTLPFYLNGQGMCLPGCFEDVALKGVFALVNRCLVFHFGRDSIESKLNEGRILIVWPTWTGWVDGPEEGRSRHIYWTWS